MTEIPSPIFSWEVVLKIFPRCQCPSCPENGKWETLNFIPGGRKARRYGKSVETDTNLAVKKNATDSAKVSEKWQSFRGYWIKVTWKGSRITPDLKRFIAKQLHSLYESILQLIQARSPTLAHCDFGVRIYDINIISIPCWRKLLRNRGELQGQTTELVLRLRIGFSPQDPP